MQKTKQHSNILTRVFELETFHLPSLIIVIIGLIIDGVNKSIEFSNNFILYLDIINIVLILLAYVLYLNKKLSDTFVISLVVYSIIFSSFISLPIRIKYPEFNLTAYFIKTEFIVFILSVAISALVDKKHILYIIAINYLFALCCLFIKPDILSVGDFIFYTSTFTGASVLAYLGNTKIIKLAINLENANKTISQKNDKLQELSQYKGNIVKVIGHDIRQPLTQISGLVEIFEDTKDESLIPLIKKSGNHALELLDDALTWNQSLSAVESIQINKFKLHDIISKIHDSLLLLLTNKKIELINSVEEDYNITADIHSMETIFRNLINNAIKFSHRNSKISINVSSDEQFDIVEIRDEGIGIPQEQFNKLFKIDKNNTTKGTEKETGSGLGLIICKNLIEKQKGKLEIQTSEGIGTSIFVFIPKR